MSSYIFKEVLPNLHLADNSALDPNDKFIKMRPLIEKLIKQCLLHNLPEQTASIDEFMVPYLEGNGVNNLRKTSPLSLFISFRLLLPD